MTILKIKIFWDDAVSIGNLLPVWLHQRHCADLESHSVSEFTIQYCYSKQGGSRFCWSGLQVSSWDNRFYEEEFRHTDGLSSSSETSVTTYQITHCHTFFFFWRNSPPWARAPSFTRFLDHTQRRAKVGRTTLDGWSARHRELYLTKHNNYTDRHPCHRWDSNSISGGQRPQTQTARPLGQTVSYLQY